MISLYLSFRFLKAYLIEEFAQPPKDQSVKMSFYFELYLFDLFLRQLQELVQYILFVCF